MNKISFLLFVVFWSFTAQADKAVSGSTIKLVDFFPLAIGNKWKYVCSVEGERAFEKELRIVKKVKIAGKPGYQATYIVNGNSSNIFFWEDDSRYVHRTYTLSGDTDEIVISRSAEIGDDLGGLHITREEVQKTSATGAVKTLVAENFDLESPDLSSEKRNEWRGQFYANGIGLVVEADGIGGNCVLKDYSVVGAVNAVKRKL